MKRRLLVLALAVAAVHPVSVRGTIFTVTRTEDAGTGTLRQAILDANAKACADAVAAPNLAPLSAKGAMRNARATKRTKDFLNFLCCLMRIFLSSFCLLDSGLYPKTLPHNRLDVRGAKTI